MTEPMLVARIVVEEHLQDDGEVLHSTVAEDAGGDDLPLVQALGMLRLAEDSLIQHRASDEGDDE